MFLIRCSRYADLRKVMHEFEVFANQKVFAGITSYKRRDGSYEIPIPEHAEKAFLDFISIVKNQDDIFKTHLVLETVRGFDSYDSAVNAVEEFNCKFVDYYIDPACDIETIQCFEGPVYVPMVGDPTLDRLFWKFVQGTMSLEETIKTGGEIYR